MATLPEDAAAFLAGTGHRVAERALARHGLPAHLADDVVQEALVRALRVAERGEAVANVEALTTTLVQRAAADLARGERRRPEGHLAATPVEEQGGEVLTHRAPGDLPEVAAVGAEAAVALRGAVAAALAGTPRAAAGALAVLAVVLDGAGPAEDCPAPAGGAGDADAATWAGLFYAGRLECFPAADAPDDPATRKRRSRAAADQRAVLEAAVATVTDRGAG